jgi:hypothetical protein
MSSPKVEAELRRLADLLEAVLRFQGADPGSRLRLGAQAIETQLGWAAGTLGRVLKGKTELKLRHVLDVLEVLGVPPEDYFDLAYGPSRPTTPEALMLYLETRNSRARQGSPSAASPNSRSDREISDQELDRRILAALRRVSKTLPPAPSGPPSQEGPKGTRS